MGSAALVVAVVLAMAGGFAVGVNACRLVPAACGLQDVPPAEPKLPSEPARAETMPYVYAEPAPAPLGSTKL